MYMRVRGISLGVFVLVLMFPEFRKDDVIIRMSENINANICLLSLTFIEKNQALNNFHS